MSIPVLSGIGDALDYYQRSVSDPVSGSILLALNKAKMGLGLGDQGSQDMSDHFGDGMPSFGAAPTSDPTGALNYAYQDNPLGRFAFQTATDPLNLVGMGLPGKLAETGLAHAIPGAVGALSGLDWADKLPGVVGNKALSTLGDAASTVATPIAAGLEPHIAQFAIDHPGLAQGSTDFIKGWKSINHLLPGYPLMTGTDDLTLMGANGELGAAKDAAQAFPSAVRSSLPSWLGGGGTTSMGSYTGLQTEMGGDLAHAVSDAGVPGSFAGVSPTDTSSVFSKWGTQPPQFDSMGNQISDGKSGLGRSIMDKLAGLDSWNKNLEQQTELAKRGSLYGQAYQSAIKDSGGLELAANKLEGYGMQGTADDLRASNGIYSPSRLAAEMRSQGATSSAVQDVVGDVSGTTGYQNAVQRAGGFGDTYNPVDPMTGVQGDSRKVPTSQEPAAALRTNQVLYRYRNDPIGDALSDWQSRYPDPVTGLVGQAPLPAGLDAKTAKTISLNDIPGSGISSAADQDLRSSLTSARAEAVMRDLAQSTFGGYKFASQNVPAFARLAAAHPALANVPTEYYRDSDIYGVQHGLPASMHGDMPMGTNPLNGDQIMFNPAELSSMFGLMGGATARDSGAGDSPVGSAINTLGGMELGINPLVKMGAQLTGQMGNDQMSDIAKPLTALSGAASLVTGQPQNLEGLLKNAMGTAQQALTGQETFPYQDYLVRRRQAELSGGANKWDATQTSGPIHDAAVTDEAHRVGINDLLRTLTPFDIQSQPKEASAIGVNDLEAQLYGLRGMGNVAAQNPTGHAYDLADPLAEKVARFESLPQEQQYALLRDPRALALLQKQKSLSLHNPQALTAGN